MITLPNPGFVPLSSGPAAPSRADSFQVLLASRPETAQPLNLPTVRPSTGEVPRPPCQPRVTLQKEGEIISGIHIQCSCGQVIDLKCAYPGT
jgi:hypothetical protein